mgnify:CR=1 FL=1|tara:strand:- start:182532 stop:184100 length:1569 start_codon:yes stop_codon:yes gene_type:complete
MLNSDELGEKGESRFKEICADASLVCNKSDRDRTGWDFIVEFPFDHVSPDFSSLDARKSPLSCHVQVKTILDSSQTISMRLSSAERLAKELKPSFVFVFKVGERLEFTESFLIHMFDERLGLILKRLRQEEKKGTAPKNINKKKISLTPSTSERIIPSGEALAFAIKKACDGEINEYVIRKSDQLKKLGFEQRPYEGKMTLHYGEDDIADVFLGLKKARATDLHLSIKRFGIGLPTLDATEGHIKIQPEPFDECTLFARTPGKPIPTIFKGKAYRPAINLPKDSNKLLFNFSIFSLLISENRGNSKFIFNFEDENEIQKIDIWISLFKILNMFSRGNGELEIRMTNSNRTIPLKFSAFEVGFTEFQLDSYRDICERVAEIFVSAGVVPTPEISINNVKENNVDIHLASSLLRNEPVSIEFQSKKTIALENATSKRFIFARRFDLAGHSIALYGLATFSFAIGENEITWESQEFFLKDIREILVGDDFDSFVEKASNIEQTTNLIVFDDSNDRSQPFSVSMTY